METKKLTRDHVGDVIQLEHSSAPVRPQYAPYDEEALNFLFDNPKTCSAYGLFDGEKLVGWGCFRTNWSTYNKEKGVYEISSIVVDKNYRRHGYGQKILDKIIAAIKSGQDYKRIYLTVSPLNVGALMLYLKNNFIIYDYKKDIYGPGADRLFLNLVEAHE